MRFLALLPVLLVAACENGQPTESLTKPLDSIVHSGSRLELRVNTLTVQSADGMNYVLRPEPYFYDKVLAHECVLEQNALGWQCQPASDATIDSTYPGHRYPTPPSDPGFIFSTTYTPYSDAACTHIIAALYDPSHAMPTTGLLTRALSNPTAVYTLGAELAFGSRLYYKFTNGPGTCNAAGGFPGSPWRIFEVGPTVSAAYVSRTAGTEVLP